jgi:putative phosphoesterase
MKILLLSDSHGNIDVMKRAAETEQPDAIFHMGDHITDAEALRLMIPAPMFCVAGNTDHALPRELLFDYGGKKFFLTHGDSFGVTSAALDRLSWEGVMGLLRHGISIGANIIAFGHTHKALVYSMNGAWIINPGSIGRGGHTYGVVDITGGALSVVIKEI